MSKTYLRFNTSLDNNSKQMLLHGLGSPQYNSLATNKIYVDNNIRNVNNKITNVVLDIIKQKIK